jgi:signal transduction histidine kinase
MFHLTEKILLKSSFVLALVLLISAAITSVSAIQQLQRDRAQADRTRTILDELHATFTEMRFAEGGRRGYLITKKQRYLEISQRGDAKAHQHLQNLYQLIQPNPELVDRANKLSALIETRLNLIHRSLEQFQKDPADSITQIRLTDEGDRLQATIWEQVEKIDQVETAVLASQRAATTQHIRELGFIEATTAGISLILLLGAYHALHKQIQQRDRAQQELEKTNLALKRSNQDLEEFAYVASHDLQEPLRVVAAYAHELSLVKGLDAFAQADLDRIIERVAQMRSLIRALLTYAKIDHSQERFVLTDLNEILCLVISNLREKAKEMNITVTAMPTLWIRRNEWIQLFQNLISNAIDAKQNHPLMIQIGAEAAASNWLFWIKDNGRGIRLEDLDHMFEPFNRLNSSGTGIGLAICQNIVNRHHGKIWAESEVGKGTTIYFSIPGINNFDV